MRQPRFLAIKIKLFYLNNGKISWMKIINIAIVKKSTKSKMERSKMPNDSALGILTREVQGNQPHGMRVIQNIFKYVTIGRNSSLHIQKGDDCDRNRINRTGSARRQKRLYRANPNTSTNS